MINQYFYNLLQVAIGNENELTSRPSDEEWALLFDMAKKQALVGIVFKGCEKLPQSQLPPKFLFIKWSGLALKLKEKNRLLTDECNKVTKELVNEGIHSVVLKGQSNRWNYGAELCDLRTPGDIDLWMWAEKGGIARIVDYSKQHRLQHGLPIMPWHRILYYHVESKTSRGTEIEMHYRPSYLNCLWRNRRLQRWFVYERERFNSERLMTKGVGKDAFLIPNNSFNAVYQLLHIYKHLFEEGIGLRQLLDYYFVLSALHKEQKTLSGSSALPLSHEQQGEKSIKGERPEHWQDMGQWEDGRGMTVKSNEEIMHTLTRFGMKKFASAVMYVLQTVFAMPAEYLICEPDEKEGKFLLNEIMQAGNFGKYDDRIARGAKSFMGFKVPVSISHAIEKTKHNLRLLMHYPEEVLWEPFFRVYHWIWRRFELWRY